MAQAKPRLEDVLVPTAELSDEQASALVDAAGPYDGSDTRELRAGSHNAAALYEKALGALPTGVIRLCANGEFLGATTAMERLLGHPEGWSPPAGNLINMVHPDDQEAAVEALARLADTSADVPWDSAVDSVEVRVETASGEFRWLDARGIDLRDDPQIAGFLVSFTDVTSRVEATEYRSEFLRTVAHELRAPLATMLGRLDILEKQMAAQVSPGPMTTNAVQLRTAALRMQRLVNDLLDSARLETHEFTLVLEDNVDVARLVAAGVADMAGEATAAQVTLSKRSTPGPPIRADAARITQVIANLVSNACKYSHPGGAVVVKAEAATDGWHIKVTDTGIGMDAATLERLGEPLFRSEDAKSHVVGTGLGFAVSKGIVAEHGGSLLVESAGLGDGTSVTVSLPFATGS